MQVGVSIMVVVSRYQDTKHKMREMGKGENNMFTACKLRSEKKEELYNS